MRPDVCFVVPSYKSRATIRATLDSIFAQQTDKSVEALVVESSGDDTADWLGKLYPQLQVVKSKQRLFAGAARNLGARRARADLMAFLDADAVAAPDWLQTLLATFSVRPDLSLIGGAVANANPDSLSGLILYWLEFSEYLPGLPSGPRAALSSSNLLLRREEFLARGGFDENYGMAEDLLLCRQWQSGFHFEGRAVIRHRQRTGWHNVRLHLTDLGYWSGRYRASHQTSGSWLRAFPALSYALPFLRAPRILLRLWRSSWQDGLRGIVLFPAVIWGLFCWARGFQKGLRSGNHANC
ncbi:MAG: glycosyltransferase [Acidobacteria bacterium]|nr:MAG: glycosyltransferase [Acidobacteriota bacterium]